MLTAAATDDTDDVLPIHFAVTSVERIRRGATLAIATVEVDISGIVLVMHFAIRREGGGIGVEVPSFIHDGRRVACVLLPGELRHAICDEVWKAWRG